MQAICVFFKKKIQILSFGLLLLLQVPHPLCLSVNMMLGRLLFSVFFRVAVEFDVASVCGAGVVIGDERTMMMWWLRL